MEQQQQHQRRRNKSSSTTGRRSSSSRRIPKDVSFFSSESGGGFGHKYFTRKHSSQISSKDVRYCCYSVNSKRKKGLDDKQYKYITFTCANFLFPPLFSFCIVTDGIECIRIYFTVGVSLVVFIFNCTIDIYLYRSYVITGFV